MAEELGRTLEQLTSTIQEQNKELKQKDSMKELDQSITALEKSGTENSARLRETLTQIQLSLDSATNEEQMELAREQLDALQGLAGTEEENRESARRQEEANEFLSKLVSGIDGLADAYDKQLDAMKPSGGLLAGLGAVALLFTDPETLFAGVRAAIDGVFAIVDSIKMFLDGDFSEGLALLGENIGAVAAIVGTVAVLFGGRIIRLVGSLVKGVQGIARAVMKVGRFIGALAGRFGGLVKIFGRLFLPFTIITGAIGAIQGAIDGFKEGGILGGLEGGISGLLTTIIGYPLDLLKSAVAWIAGKFGFKNAEATLNKFSFSTLISDSIGAIFNVVGKAVDWVKGLFTDPKKALTDLWTAYVGAWTGIAGWIYDKALKPAIDWIKGLFNWASEGIAQGWTNATDFVSSKWTEVKTWFTGLFTWASDGIAAGWTNLTDFVSGKWTSVKTWFTGLFTWAAEASQGNFILDLFNSTIEKVKTFFTDLFDFLPSFEDIKKSITGMLPDFLQPDSIDEQKAEIQNEIAEHQAQIAEGDMRYGAANVLSRENRVTELQEALSELEGLNKGGIVNAPASGGLAMLHGAEIVAPLDSPQGRVLMAINDLMNAKSVAGAGEYGGMGGPMIIQGGSNQTSNNTNNVSSSNYTIQQGITPDDFLKRDFLNFSY
jgi:hypothetical protein